jgi:hypothetical protein
MRWKNLLNWMLGTLVLLAAAGPASARTLRVQLLPLVSTAKVWRFEVVNASVHALDVLQLTAVFSADGHRLWAEPVVLTPSSILRPGQAGWVSVDVSRIPRRTPVRIDWELTWNPYPVPVLSRYWRTERAASLEIIPPASTGGGQHQAVLDRSRLGMQHQPSPMEFRHGRPVGRRNQGEVW